uniref:NB-ARC domain-containing protein n=1 Tax=Kalanchoe fedtschenkoi TaxID=63787 RepID=A0A7N1A5Q5_KALFE
MRAFLRAADAVEEIDFAHTVWVQEVRNVTYESEDVLDEFMCNLASHHGEAGICADPKYLFRSFMNLGARLDIASTVQAITQKFEKIHKRNQRYSFVNNNSLERGVSLSTIGAASQRWPDRLADALFQDKIDLVGLEGPKKKKLTDMLLSEDETLNVVSVVGMGGLGKTTLVKQVYDDPDTKKHFESHAWINVTPTFKTEELLKELIQELYKENKQPIPHIDSMDVVKRIEEVQRCLKDRRYVIVLDDVWGVHAWKEIKYAFPKDACGSRVVITTRATDVASASCTSKEHIYNLEPLSKEDSLTLFCLKTFGGKPCPDHLVGVSDRILKKCAGLPLAIVAISGVLITKDMTAVSNEWDQINRRLGTELEDNEILKSTYKILSLSYNDLPYHLRACYLYTGIFHEDQPIPRTKLIRLWIAEGFVEGKEGNTPEEVAESYLNELLNRSLLEVEERTSDGRVKSCRIHDLLREIIIRKSRDQSFAAIAKEDGGSWPEKVRRLAVHNMLQYIHNQNFPQLRSLLVFGVEEPLSRSSMTSLFAGGCKLLTVLDLQGTNLTKFPSAVIKLFNLRYLSLRDTMVKKIPKGIGALQKLETLDLKRTLVSRLPTEILKLQSLRNLLVYRYEFEGYGIFNSKFGIKAPKGIGGLKYLQKLCFVEGGQGNESILSELRTLSTLRRLGVINLINENCAALCASIDKMHLLHALSINSLKDEILNLQHITSPPKSIRRLYLMGKMNTLPHWIKSLKNLVKIVLKKTKLHNDPLKTLEELPNLVHIEFLQVHNGEKLQFKAGKFQRLKLLGIHESESLERVIVEESSMPSLERFFIESCGMLKEIPSGMDQLHKLKELHFVNMPRELITTIQLHPREGKDYKRVSHIPDVTVTYTVDGNWEIERLSTTHQHRNSQNTEMKKRINDLWEK